MFNKDSLSTVIFLVCLCITASIEITSRVDESVDLPKQSHRRLGSSKDSNSFFSPRAQGNGINRHINQGWQDVNGIFRDYKPFLPDAPFIMYWRPQKVGSSTILSLLTSYAFRYNFLPKLRSSQNYMCRKMAKCALEHLEQQHSNATDFERYSKFLRDYVNGISSGSGSKNSGRSTLKKNMYELERISELLAPYRISTNHEICNLDADLLREQLSCAFSGVAVAKKQGHMYGTSRLSILDAKTSMTKVSESEWQSKDIFTHVPPSAPPTALFKELFVVRNPLSRAMSVYYFWGELFKLNYVVRSGTRRKMKSRRSEERHSSGHRKLHSDPDEEHWEGLPELPNDASLEHLSRRRLEIMFRLGQDAVDTGVVKGPLFTYHGNESTVPPKDIAMAFANKLPYIAGMPGPSYTWSVLARNPKEAVDVVGSDRIMTIVTERLDESLVVARHYLNWSLADIVVTKVRKALSTHPKYTEWPKEAVSSLTRQLIDSGEMAVYNAATAKLDSRLRALKASGVDVESEVKQLQDIRSRVSAACLSEEYLQRYRGVLQREGFPPHSSENKLRDAEDIYTEQGHAFGYNRDILYSFDVCGNCEAHAIVYNLQQTGLKNVQQATLLKALQKKEGADKLAQLVQFRKCPRD